MNYWGVRMAREMDRAMPVMRRLGMVMDDADLAPKEGILALAVTLKCMTRTWSPDAIDEALKLFNGIVKNDVRYFK